MRRVHPVVGQDVIYMTVKEVVTQFVGDAEPLKSFALNVGRINVSKLYSAAQADAIVDAALDAGDAIDFALAAPTKHETVYYWRKVFGSAFQV